MPPSPAAASVHFRTLPYTSVHAYPRHRLRFAFCGALFINPIADIYLLITLLVYLLYMYFTTYHTSAVLFVVHSRTRSVNASSSDVLSFGLRPPFSRSSEA